MLLRERGRGVDHGLLVACLVVADAVLGPLERLAHPGHVAVAEDAEDPREEPVALPVPLDLLDLEPGHERLGDRQASHRRDLLSCAQAWLGRTSGSGSSRSSTARTRSQ